VIQTTGDPGSAPEPPRRLRLAGLHHISAVCADLERTTAFYRDVLGLPLVREGYNDDDPDARHFWFGDPGAHGILVSFMEYPALEAGRVGVGSTHHFAFAVGSAEELEGWRDWLRSREVECTDVYERNGLRSIYLRDPDGHMLELVAALPTFDRK
jgi:catechol 2,3-dioxygenase-like lactoylglutathione lyase family enzyme